MRQSSTTPPSQATAAEHHPADRPTGQSEAQVEHSITRIPLSAAVIDNTSEPSYSRRASSRRSAHWSVRGPSRTLDHADSVECGSHRQHLRAKLQPPSIIPPIGPLVSQRPKSLDHRRVGPPPTAAEHHPADRPTGQSEAQVEHSITRIPLSAAVIDNTSEPSYNPPSIIPPIGPLVSQRPKSNTRSRGFR